MALLPLAGWADAPTVTTPTAGKADLAYTGAAQELVTAGEPSVGATMYYLLSDEEEVTFEADAWTTTVPTGTNAGDYKVWSAAYKEGDGNSEPIAVNVNIAKKALALEVKANLEKNYEGTNLDLTSLISSWEGLVAGDATEENKLACINVSGVSESTIGAGTYSYSITTNADALANYTVSGTGSGTLTISKAALTVTAVDKNIVYGETPVYTYTWTGLVANDANDGQPKAGVVTIGDPTVMNGITPYAGAVGSYVITPNVVATNYAITPVNGTLNVAGKDITDASITINGIAASYTYNGANQLAAIQAGIVVKDGDAVVPANQYVVAFQKAGAATTDVINAAEDYSITIAGAGNYAGITPAKAFAIAKADLTIIVGEVPVTYGAATTLPAINEDNIDDLLTINGVKGEDGANLTYTLALVAGSGITATKVPGTYNDKVTVNVAGTAAANYNAPAVIPGALKVNKKELTVTGVNQIVTYGTDPAAVTYNYSGGWVGSDNKANSVTGNPTSTLVDAGEVLAANQISKQYINVDVSGLSSTKYTFKAANTGYILVQKATILIAPNKTTKVYGADDPALNYTVSPVSLAEKVTAVTYERTDPENENVGTYTLHITSATVTDADKYVVNYEGFFADFVIEPKELTVTVQDQTLAEGDELNKALFKVTGFVTPDTQADIFDIKLIAAVSDDGETVKAGAATTADAIVLYVKDGKEDAAANYTGWETAAAKLFVAGGDVVIMDRNNEDLVTYLTDNAGAGKSVQFSSRALEAEKWQAYILPFAIKPSELSSKVGYAIFNVLDTENTTADHVAFKIEMQNIPANTPFLMKTDGSVANMNTITIEGRTIVAPANANVSIDAADGNIQFIGIYAKKTGFGQLERFVYNNEWYNNNAKASLGAFAAYLKVSASNSAPLITVEDFNGNTTAIKTLNTQTMKAIATDGWYTINGMKLEGAPVEKGIYINNGRKVVIK